MGQENVFGKIEKEEEVDYGNVEWVQQRPSDDEDE